MCRRGAEQGLQRGQGSQRCGHHLLSVFRQHSQLRPGCHGTVSLVTHSSLWPEQKRQMKGRKRTISQGLGWRVACVGAGLGKVPPPGMRQRRAPAQGLLKQRLGRGTEQLPKGHSHRQRGEDERRRLQCVAGRDERAPGPEERGDGGDSKSRARGSGTERTEPRPQTQRSAAAKRGVRERPGDQTHPQPSQTESV